MPHYTIRYLKETNSSQVPVISVCVQGQTKYKTFIIRTLWLSSPAQLIDAVIMQAHRVSLAGYKLNTFFCIRICAIISWNLEFGNKKLYLYLKKHL